MPGIDEYTLRGLVELLKFIGLIMVPVIIGGILAFFFEKPQANERETAKEQDK